MLKYVTVVQYCQRVFLAILRVIAQHSNKEKTLLT